MRLLYVRLYSFVFGFPAMAIEHVDGVVDMPWAWRRRVWLYRSASAK